MIEPSRIQDHAAEDLALIYDSVEVEPLADGTCTVVCFNEKRSRQDNRRGGRGYITTIVLDGAGQPVRDNSPCCTSHKETR